MAPGSLKFNIPELDWDFKLKPMNFGYDLARDGYWTTGTYTDYPDQKLSARAIADAEKKLMAREQEKRQMLEAMKIWGHKVMDQKYWSKLYLGDWDVDPVGPPPDGLKIMSPPEEGPLDHERDAERARKIHNLYWARKQKDPEFNLL